MSKGKATTLLTVISVVLAIWLALTFARFPVGIKNYNSVIGAISLDYDVVGGVSYELTYDKENENTEVEDIDEVINTLSKRMDMLGYKSYKISAFKDAKKDVKDYSIRINAKKTDTVDNDVKAAAAYGKLTFYGGTEKSPTEKILEDGTAVDGASYGGTGKNGSTSYYIINVKFSDYGYTELKKLMGDGDYYLRIDVGENSLTGTEGLSVSASTFSKNYTLTTTSGEAMARQFALQIATGGLDYRYNVSDAVESEPLYGENAALYAGLALGALFIIVIAVMLVIFGGYGVISALSVLFFSLLETLMLVAVPNIVLSLSGFIGIGVATVLAADGLIITIKRIREEYALGKTVKAAIKTGYKRSFTPVLCTNLIAAIISLILFAFTGGAFNCFAVTLGIGAVISFVSVVLVSRMFVSLILPLTGDKEKFLNLKREDN